MRAARVQPNTITVSALLSAFEKEGRWEEALDLFARLPVLGVRANGITFNALIAACAAGGQWGHAVNSFLEMRLAGLSPDKATYNPLLNVVWGCEQFAYAQALMRKALEEAVYERPLVVEQDLWSVDMHKCAPRKRATWDNLKYLCVVSL